jgi:hypothetical protein
MDEGFNTFINELSTEALTKENITINKILEKWDLFKVITLSSNGWSG